MNLSEQTIMFLQSLRGAQPMIALAFLLIRRAMTIDEIQAYTSLSDDAIRPAMKSMAAKGLFYKQVGERGRVVWVPAGDTFFGKLFGQNPLLAESGSVVVNVELEGSEKLLSTTTTNKRQNPLLAESGIKTLSVKAIVKDPDEIQACLDALRELKIYGKKAEKLAEDHHITVADIEAHWKVIQGQSWDNPQGMLIYMLESHAPIEPDSAEIPSTNRYSMGVWEKESEDE